MKDEHQRMMEELDKDSIEATTLLTALFNQKDLNDFRKYYRLRIIQMWVNEVMVEAKGALNEDVINAVEEICRHIERVPFDEAKPKHNDEFKKIYR